jgi:cyclopropane fatty-acyl-phospholipid synthase-like methyltransferase
MKPELERQIADALECTPELFPYLPELLADLEELGASRRGMVDLLLPLNLPPGTRVLDLGCGKGAVLLALAEEFSFQCIGVDAFEPFIAAARRTAQARGLADKCKFRCVDLHEAVADCTDFDVAMMLGLGLAIGNQKEIVSLLRGCVRPGGYMVVDDAFLPEGVQTPVPEYAGYTDRQTTLARLQAFGDSIVREHSVPGEQREKEIQAETEKIRRRAEELAREHPEAAELIRAYVHRQEREAELARESIVDALWLLQRTG